MYIQAPSEIHASVYLSAIKSGDECVVSRGSQATESPASAPANPESPYLQAAYQAQFKRPATAIPPHLCIGGSSLSPLGSPQLAYMYGSLPTEMGSSLGSYNSIQSEGAEFASPGNDPMNLVTMSNPLYDVQIPGSPAAQQQAAMAFAGGKNPGMAPSVGLGLPSQLHVPGRQDGGVEAGRAQTMGAATHRRTMTDESSDSISNIPLIERSVFGGSYETDGGYTNSAMSVNYNQQQQYHFSLPSDFGALGNGAESGGSALACNSQEYMDLIASYGLSHDPNTVAPAANYHMLMDSKLGGWEPHHPQLQQQPQQREQPASGLMSGIAPELTVNPPPPSQHQEPP
ncbi:hypothetical protein GGI10_001352 [Coemansia sp. RSA 2530]|nr:hypothetical protein GGI10_001352 [Coemansia sp. RSA 2530]